MIDVGVPGHFAEMNAQAVTLFAQGDSDWITDDVPPILGRPPRTFEQFVTDYGKWRADPGKRCGAADAAARFIVDRRVWEPWHPGRRVRRRPGQDGGPGRGATSFGKI